MDETPRMALREKQLRRWVAAFCGLFVVELSAISKKYGTDPTPVDGWQLGLLLVVPFILTVLFAMLLRAYWWRTGRGLLGRVEKVIFWVLVVTMSFAWIGIGLRFLGP